MRLRILSDLHLEFADWTPDRVDADVVTLWIHGHTHRSVDYRLGSTRVVANPRGYPEQRDTGFKPDAVLEL